MTLVQTLDPGQRGRWFSSSGNVIHTPDTGFTGVETITYTIRDNHGLTNTGLATVLVGTTGDRPPVAQSGTYDVQAGGTLPINLSAVDPNGQPLTWTLVTPPNWSVDRLAHGGRTAADLHRADETPRPTRSSTR